MQLDITDEAVSWVVQRGGTAAVDFIKPIGWGGVQELSVDTHLKGKNLAPYRRVTHGEATFLLHPDLMDYASRVRIVSGRKFLRTKLLVELDHEHNHSCRHW